MTGCVPSVQWKPTVRTCSWDLLCSAAHERSCWDETDLIEEVQMLVQNTVRKKLMLFHNKMYFHFTTTPGKVPTSETISSFVLMLLNLSTKTKALTQMPATPSAWKILNFRLTGLQNNQLLDFLCCWEMNKHSVCVTQRRVFPQPFLLPSQANSAEMFILCWYPSSGACWDVQIHT